MTSGSSSCPYEVVMMYEILLYLTYNCSKFFGFSAASDFPVNFVKIPAIGFPPAFTFTFVSPESAKSISKFL